MFSHNIYFESCIWTAHTTTIILLAIYLYKSFQNRARNYTTTIICIFNFLLILYPISLLLFSWLEHIIYHLTIYWATVFAIFTHGVLNASEPFPFRSFMFKSFVICLFLSICSFYVIDRNFSEKSYLSLLLDLTTTAMPLIVISVYYSRAYDIIISGQLGSSVFAKASASKILWYSRITLICHAPEIIMDILLIIDLMRGKGDDGWSKYFIGDELKKMFDSVWALLNLWVDYSVMGAHRERAITRYSLEREGSMSWLVDQEDESQESKEYL